MTKQKLQDWILNIINNPMMNTSDFRDVGITADNTSLLSEETYLTSDKIRNHSMFKDEQGNFDKNKFHKFYENALLGYNMLSNDTALQEFAKQQVVYGKDDIFAPAKQRKKFSDIVKYDLTDNENRATFGLSRINRQEKPRYSPYELAQTLQVLLNPVEAAKDPNKAKWDISPNDSWFHNFFDTRVMALWDEDGEHTDPVTGEKKLHKKGEFKINENGTYYYENLDGRDIYGRLVLNKMDTLTTDGTFLNRFDWFDSDGLESPGVVKSTLKNLSLVGTMFLPYVGPWVAGISVLTQAAGLFGTAGRMATGSDTKIFNELEGWAKSVNRLTARSQYAREHTWSLENFINLVGDVAGQLKEQRFLFEFAPALIKGTSTVGWNGISETKKAKYVDNVVDNIRKANKSKMDDLLDAHKNLGTMSALDFKSFSSAMTEDVLRTKGNAAYDAFMKDYYKIGGDLSKIYMAGITTADAYGEFKNAGLSDLEAAAMTLGFAGSELWLLNTGIGEWILPELKGEKAQIRNSLKTYINSVLKTDVDKAAETSTKEGKLAFINKWIKNGKDFAKLIDINGKGLPGLFIAGALGEGTEEVSEEALADMWRGIADLSLWIQGKNGRTFSTDGMFDRYAMSFVGGALGGGLTGLGTGFNLATKLDSNQARMQLIYLAQLGRKQEMFDMIDKMNFGSDNNLSFDTTTDSNGIQTFIPADDNHISQEQAIKNAFKEQFNQIDNILKVEGLDISKDNFFDLTTFKDLRLANLQSSPVSTMYFQDFINLTNEIVKTKLDIETIQKSKPDSGDFTQTLQDELTNLNQKLLELRKQKEYYQNGQGALDYVGMVLMDMSPVFSQYFTKSFFKDFVEQTEHKPFNEVSDDRKNELKEKFEQWKGTYYRDKLHVLAPMYRQMAINFGMFLTQFVLDYDKIRQNNSILDLVKQQERLQLLAANGLGLDGFVEGDEATLLDWLALLQKILRDDDVRSSLIKYKNSKWFDQTIKPLIEQYNQIDKKQEKENIKLAEEELKKALNRGEDDLTPFENAIKAANVSLSIQSKMTLLINIELLNNIDLYFNDFSKTGVINPIIKKELQHAFNKSKKFYEYSKDFVDGDIDALVQGFELVDNSNPDSLTMDDLDYESYQNESAKQFLDSFALAAAFFEFEWNTDTTLKEVKDFLNLLKLLGENIDKTELKLNSILYTNVFLYIQLFILANSDSHLDINKLIDTVDGIINQNKSSLDTAELSGSIDLINEAIEVLGWLQGLTLGAQKDPGASLDNLMGYNVSMNQIAKEHHVKDYIPLPEISLESAQIINQDIELVKNKLIQARNIYYINSGQKLNLLNKVAMNKNFIDYSAMQRFIVNVDDSWAETQEQKDTLKEWRDAVEEAKTLKLYSQDRKQNEMSEEDKDLVFLEKRRIDKAIYDFFLTNKDKIEKGFLKELFKKNFNLYSTNKLIINENTEFLNDRNLLNYIASRAALDMSAFQNDFASIIDPESGLAPLPTQEEAVFQNLASILNGDTIDKFRQAYIDAIVEDFASISDVDERKKKLLDSKIVDDNKAATYYAENPERIKQIDLIPKFGSFVFTEGIPGSGKSAAVDWYTIQMIKKVKPELIDKAIAIHTNEDTSKKFAEGLGISKYYTHDLIMKLIYSKYNTARTIDNEGYKLYDKSEFVENNGYIEFNDTVDEIAPEHVPSFIIIDEISHFDEVDLKLLNDFARKHGISILVSGDYDLSILKARVEKYFNDSNDLILSSAPTFFMGAPKLGVSMRTGNIQLDKTITKFRSRTKNNDPVNFYYYENNTEGLNGVKSEANFEEFKKSVKRIFDTANGEKVGFIYYDENSPILDFLEKEYSGKFEKYKGNAAQGLEGKYFIVDFPGVDSDYGLTESLTNDLYTAITRSEKGTLVYSDATLFKNHKENTTANVTYSELGIKNFAKKRKELLEKHKSGTTLEYKPRTKVDITGNPLPQLNSSNALPAPQNGKGVPKKKTPPKITPSSKQKLSPDNLWSILSFDGPDAYDGNSIHSQLVHFGGNRIGVIVDIDGLRIPFYCSTGKAGKKSPAGKWYPIFGLGPIRGWLNKTNDDDIMAYYNMPLLKSIAESLDLLFGDVRLPNDIFEEKGKIIDPAFGTTRFLSADPNLVKFFEDNVDLQGVDNHEPDTLAKVQENIRKVYDHIQKISLKYVKYNVGQNITIKGRPDTTDGVYEIREIVDNGNGFSYKLVNTNDASEIIISASEVDGDTTTYNPGTILTPTWKHPNDIIDIHHKGKIYASDGEIVGEYNPNGTVSIISNDDIVKEINYIYQVLKDYASIPEDLIYDTIAEHEMQEKPDENPHNLLHSFNARAFGVNIDENGKISFLDSDKERYDYRFDGVIGLLKVFEKDWWKPKRNGNDYKTMFDDLLAALLYYKDKSDIMGAVSEILEDNEVSSVEFGLVSTPNISKANRDAGQKWGHLTKPTGDNAKYMALGRNADELTEDDAVDDSVNIKMFSGIIRLTNGKSISIPLFVLGNINTLTANPESEVGQKLLAHKSRAKNFYEYMKAVSEDTSLPLNIRDRAKMFTFTDAGYFKINDSTWTPAKNLKNFGPGVVGTADSDGNYTYEAEPIPISLLIARDPRIKYSSQIYTSTGQTSDGFEIGNIGHKYILATRDPNLTCIKNKLQFDLALKELYLKLLRDSDEPKTVARLYVTPPSIPIKDYLDSVFKMIYSGNKIGLGTHLTSYYVFDKLVSNLEDPAIKNVFTNEAKLWIKDIIAKIKPLKDEIDLLKANKNYDLAYIKLAELVSKLIAPYTFDKPIAPYVEVNTNIQRALNSLLVQIFTDHSSNPVKIVQSKLDALALILLREGLDSIVYNPKLMNALAGSDWSFTPVLTDLDSNGNSKYSINGLEFSVTAKVVPEVLGTNDEFDGIMHEWIENTNWQIHPKAPNTGTYAKYGADTKNAVEGVTNTSGPHKTVHTTTSDLCGDIKIELIGPDVYVNGNKTNLKWDDVKNYKALTSKQVLDVFAKAKVPFGPKSSNKIKDAINNGILLTLSDLKPYVKEAAKELCEIYNSRPNNDTIYYWYNDLLLSVKFTDTMAKLGITSLNPTISNFIEVDKSGFIVELKGGYKLEINTDTLSTLYPKPTPRKYKIGDVIEIYSETSGKLENAVYRIDQITSTKYGDMYNLINIANNSRVTLKADDVDSNTSKYKLIVLNDSNDLDKLQELLENDTIFNIDDDNPSQFYKSLENIGAAEEFILLYEDRLRDLDFGDLLSEYSGNKRFIKFLEGLDNRDEYLELVLHYLKDEDLDSCKLNFIKSL